MIKNKKKLSLKNSTIILSLILSYTLGFYTDDISNFFHDKMKKPTVSIVMSTYNRDNVLPTAMDSILNQTYKDFELIVVDDGSKDKTKEILNNYAKKDKRVVILRNSTNKGLVAGLNKGLNKAKGKYIARMDDDDISLPFRLERQVLAMEQNPHITLLGAGFGNKDSKKQEKDPIIVDPDEIELSSYFSSALAHPTIIFRRDFIEKNKIRYDEKYIYAEDCGFYKKIFEHGGKISNMSEPVLIFSPVKGLKRPDKYYDTQVDSFKKLQKEKLKPFFNAPQDVLGAFAGQINRCKILKEMIPVNKTKQIVNHDVLLARYEKHCPTKEEKYLYLSHPSWDHFIMINEDNTIYRKDIPEETGSILSQGPNHVMIKWDNYNTPELFVKINDDEYKFTEDLTQTNDFTVFNIEHPYWKDQIIVSNNKSFFRKNDFTQKGKIIKETKDSLTIEWANWPDRELFEKKDSNTLIFKKKFKKTK